MALGDISPYQAWFNYAKIEKERTKEKEKITEGVYNNVT